MDELTLILILVFTVIVLVAGVMVACGILCRTLMRQLDHFTGNAQKMDEHTLAMEAHKVEITRLEMQKAIAEAETARQSGGLPEGLNRETLQYAPTQ